MSEEITENISSTDNLDALLEKASKLKTEGNTYFGKGDFEQALATYFSALDVLPDAPYLHESEVNQYPDYYPDDEPPYASDEYPPPEPESTEAEAPATDPSQKNASQDFSEPKSLTDLRASLCNNIALSYIKLSSYSDASRYAAIVLRHPGFENNVKALFRKALADENLGKLEESLDGYKQIVVVEPSNKEAQSAVKRLEVSVQEKHEKEKEELIGKLKNLGNKLLGKVGLSLDNFKVQKDEKSGGYKNKQRI